MALIATTKRLIVGLGPTGHAIARHLFSLGLQFDAVDTRNDEELKFQFELLYPDSKVYIGDLKKQWLDQFDEIIVSPGVPPSTAGLNLTTAPQISDIQLFRRSWPLNQSLIAITGSNAKSTVTALVCEILRANKRCVLVGGNFGIQALDLLSQSTGNDIAVLELSSFQLERTSNLSATVATCLNMTPDHLDWHGSMVSYHRAKHRIFQGAESVVINADDPLSSPLIPELTPTTYFGLQHPDFRRFGIMVIDGENWISLGTDPWIAISELPSQVRHMQQNVMAALAICFRFKLDKEATRAVIRQFKELPHRMQELGTVRGIRFINDSKGTNVGASENAIRSTAVEGTEIHLIAGGQTKDANFARWAETAIALCKSIIVYGRDRRKIVKALADRAVSVESLDLAFIHATRNAKTGDVVLLSPACSSFDQFLDYQDRGLYFTRLVEEFRAV